ncbi:hypothetical protein PhaeoP128_00433 [Phaeobacter gallaeciensis]|nr:hypothetical protein PhaeoP129_00433 [Phaeobacter gallaeciensis]ATF21205.1 hypothetical protein PhaeoP128_00433 [Phaeobacter gallaeciensis]
MPLTPNERAWLRFLREVSNSAYLASGAAPAASLRASIWMSWTYAGTTVRNGSIVALRRVPNTSAATSDKVVMGFTWADIRQLQRRFT